MKGWHKHGVCAESEWCYRADRPGSLTGRRQDAALRNPLGAYYRVHPKRVDLQAALNEVEAVLVTAQVHAGWSDPPSGVIPFDPDEEELSGHAFAVLGYTEDGFLVQSDAECQASKHRKFDNDLATMNSMLSTIVGVDPAREFSRDDLDY